MIFFYEILFVAAAIAAVAMGEFWSRTGSLLFLLGWWGFVAAGYASFGARLTQSDARPLSDEDLRWYRDARDGLRHLRLLFGIATALALLWRLVAG